MQTRRQFGKLAVAGGIASIGLTSMGLSCGSVFSAISNYIPIGLAAFQAIVDILDPAIATPLAVAIAAVKAAFADLEAAVSQYNNAPAASKATLLGKISTMLAAVEAELQQFWNDAHIPDSGLAGTISALLGVILSTIAAFIPQLPPPAPTPATERRKALAKTLPVVPSKRTPGQFKKDFNAILAANGLSSHAIY